MLYFFGVLLLLIIALGILVISKRRRAARSRREAEAAAKRVAREQLFARIAAEDREIEKKLARKRLYGRSCWLEEVDAIFEADPNKTEILFGVHSKKEERRPEGWSLESVSDQYLRTMLSPIYPQFIDDIGGGKGYKVEAYTWVTPEGGYQGMVFKVIKENAS